MVECFLAKENVACSNHVSRSTKKSDEQSDFSILSPNFFSTSLHPYTTAMIYVSSQNANEILRPRIYGL